MIIEWPLTVTAMSMLLTLVRGPTGLALVALARRQCEQIKTQRCSTG